MLGLLATMALIRSRAGRTLVRCLAIVGILFVYKYLIFVKIIIAFLVISEVASWMIPLFTPPQPEISSTFFPPDTNMVGNDGSRPGPRGGPWRQQEGKQEEEMLHGHNLKDFGMQQERGPTKFMAAAFISNDNNYRNSGPTRSNWRQKEEIDRHLQRLAMAAAAADAAAATVNSGTSPYYSERVIQEGYPENNGGTFGAAIFTGSNPSATQADSNRDITDFWTWNQFPVSTPSIAAPHAASDHLRYGSPGLGHSKSLPEYTKRPHNYED